MDAVTAVVEELVSRLPKLTISRFYGFSVERALHAYRESPELVERELREYFMRRREERSGD